MQAICESTVPTPFISAIYCRSVQFQDSKRWKISLIFGHRRSFKLIKVMLLLMPSPVNSDDGIKSGSMEDRQYGKQMVFNVERSSS